MLLYVFRLFGIFFWKKLWLEKKVGQVGKVGHALAIRGLRVPYFGKRKFSK